ncbi:MAG: hypothetical protein WB902_21560 [Acetobacteraceae bacterium]|jgi:hypothetical protein
MVNPESNTESLRRQAAGFRRLANEIVDGDFRRRLLGLAADYDAQAVTITAMHQGASCTGGGRDAELISLCDRMVANQGEYRDLHRARGSPGNPDNDPVVGHKLDALKDEWNAIMPRLAATIPTTLLGAKAVARAALVSITERKIDWKPKIDNPGEQLLYNAIKWLAED